MTVKEEIRLTIAELAGNPFNWGGCKELPIRPDVSRLTAILFSNMSGVGISWKSLEEIDFEDVILNPDGTVSIHFMYGSRELSFNVVTLDVIYYFKSIESNSSSIEGMIRVKGMNDFSVTTFGEVDDLFRWLKQE